MTSSLLIPETEQGIISVFRTGNAPKELTFHNFWYAHVRVRIKVYEMLVLRIY